MRIDADIEPVDTIQTMGIVMDEQIPCGVIFRTYILIPDSICTVRVIVVK